MTNLIVFTFAIAIIIFLIWWLFISTEGVFLGKRVVIWLYNMTAHRYDDIKAYTPEEETMLVVEPILSFCQVERPHLLDVGTGTGRVPYFLLLDGRFDGDIVGLDAAEKMLTIAEENLSEITPTHNVNLIHHEAAPLPFPDSHFDIVTSLETLEFLPDHKAALREMVRVLKPGGILMTTRRADWEAPLFLNRYYTKEGMKKLLTEMRLKEIIIMPWVTTYNVVFGRKMRG